MYLSNLRSSFLPVVTAVQFSATCITYLLHIPFTWGPTPIMGPISSLHRGPLYRILRWCILDYKHRDTEPWDTSRNYRLKNGPLKVLEAWMESGSWRSLQCLDLNTCDLISEGVLNDFLTRCGQQLLGLNLGGQHKLLEWFWMTNFPKLPNIKFALFPLVRVCPKVYKRFFRGVQTEVYKRRCTNKGKPKPKPKP